MKLDKIISDFDARFKQLKGQLDTNEITPIEFHILHEKLLQEEERAIVAGRVGW
jgi:hypothetical protein